MEFQFAVHMFSRSIDSLTVLTYSRIVSNYKNQYMYVCMYVHLLSLREDMDLWKNVEKMEYVAWFIFFTVVLL